MERALEQGDIIEIFVNKKFGINNKEGIIFEN